MTDSPDRPDTTTAADTVARIVDESDYLGEAAMRVSHELGMSFRNALKLVMEEFDRAN